MLGRAIYPPTRIINSDRSVKFKCDRFFMNPQFAVSNWRSRLCKMCILQEARS
ncbi:MAG: hypothetical protein RM338_01635 [Nostoc sp. DedQUE12a]|nr:hypothetical protein [Nostoc sp. DedQUE12a]